MVAFDDQLLVFLRATVILSFRQQGDVISFSILLPPGLSLRIITYSDEIHLVIRVVCSVLLCSHK